MVGEEDNHSVVALMHGAEGDRAMGSIESVF